VLSTPHPRSSTLQETSQGESTTRNLPNIDCQFRMCRQDIQRIERQHLPLYLLLTLKRWDWCRRQLGALMLMLMIGGGVRRVAGVVQRWAIGCSVPFVPILCRGMVCGESGRWETSSPRRRWYARKRCWVGWDKSMILCSSRTNLFQTRLVYSKQKVPCAIATTRTIIFRYPNFYALGPRWFY